MVPLAFIILFLRFFFEIYVIFFSLYFLCITVDFHCMTSWHIEGTFLFCIRLLQTTLWMLCGCWWKLVLRNWSCCRRPFCSSQPHPSSNTSRSPGSVLQLIVLAAALSCITPISGLNWICVYFDCRRWFSAFVCTLPRTVQRPTQPPQQSVS